jgi:hypothetical protein
MTQKPSKRLQSSYLRTDEPRDVAYLNRSDQHKDAGAEYDSVRVLLCIVEEAHIREKSGDSAQRRAAREPDVAHNELLPKLDHSMRKAIVRDAKQEKETLKGGLRC